MTPDALGALIAYAHSLSPSRRVYVTLNTLLRDDEWADALRMICLCDELGADAIIIQDMGVYSLARRYAPSLRLHASTQMAIHNREGVEAAEELGFKRVTLARELTLDEICDACAVPGIEVETFVHGALCYSYSGLCLYSALALGRSGNRGRCAYLCRNRFSLLPEALGKGAKKDHGSFMFSMKDIMLADHIYSLQKAGVSALKIEGRMKSPLYVAAVVHFYRRLLDGKLAQKQKMEAEAELKAVFSRPWTDLYITGRNKTGVIEPALPGHRGLPAGVVQAVLPGRGREPGRLRFRLLIPLERHDGLQFDIVGHDKPYGFPVDSLKLHDAKQHSYVSVFEAPAGSLVEVALPAGHPPVADGSTINLASSQAVKRKYAFPVPKPGFFRRRTKLSIIVELGKSCLRASAQPLTSSFFWKAEVQEQGVFDPARDAARILQSVRSAFEKLGNTGFVLGEIDVRNPDNVFIPVSRLNDLRRMLMQQAESAQLAARQKRIEGFLTTAQYFSKKQVCAQHGEWSLKFKSADDAKLFEPCDWEMVGEVTLEIGGKPLKRALEDAAFLARALGRERLRLALPLITREWERDDLRRAINCFIGDGWLKWEIGNLSGWSFLRGMAIACKENLNIATDWSMYALNRQAIRCLREIGATRIVLSPEDGLANARLLAEEAGEYLAFLVFQDTPLFISETCIRADASGKGGMLCAKCPKELDVVSSHGDVLKVIQENCRIVTVGKQPICRAGRLNEIAAAGIGWLRADFAWRPRVPMIVRDLWRRMRSDKTHDDNDGNIERGLL